jgi:hypothetical protein
MWFQRLTDFRWATGRINFSAMQLVQVDTAAVRAMAVRWGSSAGELDASPASLGLGLSCQPSAVAVVAAHADVTGFAAALAGRVGTRAAHVVVADARYLANEADAADEMAAVASRVFGG